METDKTLHDAIIRHARNDEVLKNFSSAKVLTDEGDKIFVSYEIPGRGSVSAWVPVGTPDTIEEEPRTVAFLRNKIDEIDHYRNRALTVLQHRKDELHGRAGSEDFDPFMALTVILAEEETNRLMRELRELTD